MAQVCTFSFLWNGTFMDLTMVGLALHAKKLWLSGTYRSATMSSSKVPQPLGCKYTLSYKFQTNGVFYAQDLNMPISQKDWNQINGLCTNLPKTSHIPLTCWCLNVQFWASIDHVQFCLFLWQHKLYINNTVSLVYRFCYSRV